MLRGGAGDVPPWRRNRGASESTAMQAMNEKARQLCEAATRQLEWDPQVTSNASALPPRIMRWAERDQAEQAAWAAPGVSEVIDHISVVP